MSKNIPYSMKDILINLLQTVPTDYFGNYGIGKIADHLLAGDVIALPCKVGSTVYSFCSAFGVVLPYFVEGLSVMYLDENTTIYQYEANCSNKGELLDSIDFEFDDIGVSVFLTREAAENAYKGVVFDSN